MTRLGVVAASMVSLLLACASLSDSPDSSDGVVVTGRVTATGSAPHVILVLVTGTGDYEIVGKHAGELWGLQQRSVTARGRVVRQAYGPGFPAQLEVDDFQVVGVKVPAATAEHGDRKTS